MIHEVPQLKTVWRNCWCSASCDGLVVGSIEILEFNFCTKIRQYANL